MSFVYVISEDAPLEDEFAVIFNLSSIKVGYTSDSVEKRISQLQTGNLRELNIVMIFTFDSPEMARQIEKLLHFNLKDFRIQGEWFRYDKSVYWTLMQLSNLSYDFECFSAPAERAVANG